MAEEKYTTVHVDSNTVLCLEGIFTQDQVDYRLLGNLPISIFGILINLINIAVFLHADMRRNLVNIFLLAISITDLLLLIFNFFFLLFPVIALLSKSFILHGIYPIVLRFSYPLARIAQTCGIYLTLSVSVHRYLGVCHPFRAKRWITRTPVKYAIFCSIMFSILINATTWLELTVVPCFSSKFQRSSMHIQLTELQMNYTYGIVVKVITYTLTMFVIPFITLIILNTQIILTLRRSSDMRSTRVNRKAFYSNKGSGQSKKLSSFSVTAEFITFGYSFGFCSERYKDMTFCSYRSAASKPCITIANFHSSSRDTSVTLMLLAIVAMFLTCNGLAFCNNIIEILIFVDKIDSTDTESAFESSVEIANILVSSNSSTSIFVYLIFSSKYRAIVKQYLGLKKPQKSYGVAMTAAIAARQTFEFPFVRYDPKTCENRL